MNTAAHSNANDPGGRSLTRRAYPEQFTGRKLLGVFLILLSAAAIAVASRAKEHPLWLSALFPCLIVALTIRLFLLREVTVDAAAGVTHETWRLLGVLPVRKRQRSLREFAAVRSQRVEVLSRGDRHVYCDVYFVPAAGAGKRLDVERFDMEEADTSPEGAALGRDLAQLTGLPFEDKC